ncbi:MAG: hypothetical protein IJY92_00015 [Alphaproteobacteria bacterium]|nr:hypothetical protein [Alphaproteobacteria bacterium]
MKKQESGRSMVEMLGVLAIIGVLSIGGIAGYMLSMNRFRANSLIDKASKFATIAYSAKQTEKALGKTDGLSPSTFAFSDQKLGSIDSTESITLTSFGSTDGKVQVTVKFASADVCDTARSILGITTACAETGKDTLTLTFQQN